MTAAEALERAHAAGRSGRFRVSGHVRRDHMKPSALGGRGVQFGDIREALMTCTSAVVQDNGKWRVDGGSDLDGDELTPVCAIENGVLVVTIF